MSRPLGHSKVHVSSGGRAYVQNALRCPPALHEAMRASAVAAGRTLNAEMVRRLEASFGDGFQLEAAAAPAHNIADDIAAIRKLLEQLATRGQS